MRAAAGNEGNKANEEPIQVEISKERFRELKLTRNDQVFIRPSRFDLFPTQIH